MSKPENDVPKVEDVKDIERTGPWDTKSGGVLSVLFALPFDDLQNRYFHYEPSELAKLTGDIRGLRSYAVVGIPVASVGANEWHRVRNELVFATRGSFRWTSEDLYGNKKESILDSKNGVWVPPYILHTYEAIEDLSALVVVANTLFIPDLPETHDTYSKSEFQKLQAIYSGELEP